MARQSQVYLQVPFGLEGEEVLVQLTVSTMLDITMETQISNHPTLSTQVVSDNAVNQPKSYNISGMISDIKNLSLIDFQSQLDVRDNFKILETIRDLNWIFTLHFDNDQPPVDNCIISNLKFKKSSAMGTSYNVDLSITQILLNTEPLLSEERFKDDVTKNQSSGKNTKSVVIVDDEEFFSIIARGFKFVENEGFGQSVDAALGLNPNSNDEEGNN